MIDSEKTKSDKGRDDSKDNSSADNNSAGAESSTSSLITSTKQPGTEELAHDLDSIKIEDNHSVPPPETSPDSSDIDMIGDNEFSLEQDNSSAPDDSAHSKDIDTIGDSEFDDPAQSSDIDMIGDSEFSDEQDDSTTSTTDNSSDIDMIGDNEFAEEPDNSTSLDASPLSTNIGMIGNIEFSVEHDDATTSRENPTSLTEIDQIDINEFSPRDDLGMVDGSEYAIAHDSTSAFALDSTEQQSTPTEIAPNLLSSASLQSLIRSSADKEKTTKSQADTHTKINESEVIGQILYNKFVIVDIIGRGEASMVFSAMDLESQETFAIKTPKHFSNDIKEKFKAASILHGKLKHPNIAKTRSYLEAPSGIPYLILENIQGACLKQLFDSNQTIESEETIVAIVSQICDALEYAHNLNIVHGKLSPSNIFLTEENERLCIKVLDFSVADALADKTAESSKSANPYRSPENASSVESDVYSLGVITYQMVAGRLPDVRLSNLGETELTSLASFRPDLGSIQALDVVLAEALDRNPDWRLNSVALFKKGLDDWINAVRRERTKQALSSSEQSAQAVSPEPISSSGNAPQTAQGNAKHLLTTGSETGIQNITHIQRQHLTGIQRARDKVNTTLHRLVALAHQPLELVLPKAEEKSGPQAPTMPHFDDGRSLIGQVLFDSYAVLDVLKQGPTTITFLTKHLSTGRQLVLKTVRHRSLFEAFSRDVRAQAPLKHQNIVEHFGFIETSDGTPVSISEYVEGVSLDEFLSSCGRVESEEDLAGIALQIISAVAYAHGLGTVHANLKPTNILIYLDVEVDGVSIKLLDFGPARAQAELALASQDATIGSKLDFNSMSPEQVLHGTSTFNTDVYNIGQLLYESATGKPAHPSSTLPELRMRFSDSSLPSPSLIDERPDLRNIESLDRLLKMATVTDPTNRLQSITELNSAVESWIYEVRGQKTEEQRQLDLEVKIQRSKDVVKQSMYNLVALRQQQLAQEQTVMMKFASAAATSGPRQSPIKSATRLITLIVATCLICIGCTVYVFTNFEQLKSVWSSASRALASIFMKDSTTQLEQEFALVEEPTEEEVDPKRKKKKKGADQQTSSSPADQTNSPANKPTRYRARFNYAESPDYTQYIVKTRLGRRKAEDTPAPGEIPQDPVNYRQQRSSYTADKWANRMKGR